MTSLRRVFLLALAAALAAVTLMTADAPILAQKKGKDKGGPKHVFTGPPPARPFDVILARPTNKSITISVLAYKDLEALVTYGTEVKPFAKTDPRTLKANEPAEFVLTGLEADTQYAYRLQVREPGGEFRADDVHTFHTQRKPGGPFVFTIQADSHLDQATRPAMYERTLANALADQPDFHIDLGDTFMTEKYTDFKDSLPQYQAQRYYFGKIAHSSPLFLVLGNHDGERGDRFDGTPDSMPAWSCRTRKKYFPNPFPDGFYTGNATETKGVGRLENYYAWEWGDALFVALDPFWTSGRVGRGKADGNWSRTLGKEQYDWLAKTLAGSKARYKFVFIHHLVGGIDDSGRGGAEAAALFEWGGKSRDGKEEFAERRSGWPAPIHQLLVKHHVTAVFHGHDHFFASQERDGVAYIMVPQPGHPGGPDRVRNADEYGYVRGDFLPPSGHIRVSVSPTGATAEYIRAYLEQTETVDRKNRHVGFTVKFDRGKQ